MDSRIFQVVHICLPVFAMIGLGKLLDLRRALNAEHRQFINWLIFNISLPALIFRGVAKQPLVQLFDPGLVIGAFLPIILTTLVFFALRKALGYQGGFAAAFVFGSFWANITYIGFPLSQNAFGDEGFAVAAVYNAFVLPAFVVLGFVIIGLFGAGGGSRGVATTIKRAFLNPVILSAVAGILVALLAALFRDEEGLLQLPVVVAASFELVDSFLEMLGSIGLPLALLSIGAALRLEHAEGHAVPLALVALGKLVLMPLFALLTFRYALPLFGIETSRVTVGVTVLLSAMPNAVGSYVVACQVGVEEGFVSTMLVVTTLASIVAIPFWLYFII